MGRPPAGAADPDPARRLDHGRGRALGCSPAPTGASRRRSARRFRSRRGHRGRQRAGRSGHRSGPAAVHGSDRVRARSCAGLGGSLVRRRLDRQLHRGGFVRLGRGGCSGRGGGDARVPDRPRRQQRRHLLAARDRADGPALGKAGSYRQARDRLPRDRRSRLPGAATSAPRRPRAGDGALARGRHAPARRVGDGPLVADRRKPGRDPARIEREHPRLPLGREGERQADDVFRAWRLLGDRAAAHQRFGSPGRRWDEPRESALGRCGGGDPDGESHRRRAEGESRLPGVLRERTQRHAGRGALHRRGRHRDLGCSSPAPTRHPAARTPGRDLSARARGDVRVPPRPHRLLGDLGRSPRSSRHLRDALRL